MTRQLQARQPWRFVELDRAVAAQVGVRLARGVVWACRVRVEGRTWLAQLGARAGARVEAEAEQGWGRVNRCCKVPHMSQRHYEPLAGSAGALPLAPLPLPRP